MERQEFCNKLTELRKGSGVKVKDICFTMQSAESAMYRIENGKHSFSMDSALLYLSAINVQLTLKKGKAIVLINEHDSIAKWLKKNREKGYTLSSLAEKAGCSDTTITHIEQKKRAVGIDIFLQLADVLGFSIELSPKKLNEQLHTNKK